MLCHPRGIFGPSLPTRPAVDSTLSLDGSPPLPVRRPATAAEVGELVRAAAAAGEGVYPVGGRTGLDVGLPPSKPGVALDTTALDGVIDYPARDMTITVQAGTLPWIGLTLACSFGAYGLMRKVATLGALEALTLETLLLTPPALIAWWWITAQGTASFPGMGLERDLWLIGVGPVTAIPLLLLVRARAGCVS